MDLKLAVVTAGTASLMYQAGRLIGPPITGFISDRLVVRGISRFSLAVGFLLLATVVFLMMPLGIGSIAILHMLAFLMGVAINMYPLVTTAIWETYGSQRTASVMGFLNTFAQLSGATGLLISGYLGIGLNNSPGNALEEYPGIWLVGIVGCVGAIVLGLALKFFPRPATTLLRTASSESDRL
jgi:MFS family permease